MNYLPTPEEITERLKNAEKGDVFITRDGDREFFDSYQDDDEYPFLLRREHADVAKMEISDGGAYWPDDESPDDIVDWEGREDRETCESVVMESTTETLDGEVTTGTEEIHTGFIPDTHIAAAKPTPRDVHDRTRAVELAHYIQMTIANGYVLDEAFVDEFDELLQRHREWFQS